MKEKDGWTVSFLSTAMGKLQGMLDATIAENCRLEIVEMFSNKFWDSWLNFAQHSIISVLRVLGRIQILNLRVKSI